MASLFYGSSVCTDASAIGGLSIYSGTESRTCGVFYS